MSMRHRKNLYIPRARTVGL